MKRKKMNNPLSVWTFPYRKKYYLTHPWKWINEAYWNIRNFWHRGRYGYSYVDAWNIGDWAPRVIAEALRYMADNGHGYPGYSPWETPEKWRTYLHELANKMQRCADFMDSEFDADERNEYKEAFYAILHHSYKQFEKDGAVYSRFEMTENENAIKRKYYERQKELQEVDRRYAREVFGFFGENLARWWD